MGFKNNTVDLPSGSKRDGTNTREMKEAERIEAKLVWLDTSGGSKPMILLLPTASSGKS